MCSGHHQPASRPRSCTPSTTPITSAAGGHTQARACPGAEATLGGATKPVPARPTTALQMCSSTSASKPLLPQRHRRETRHQHEEPDAALKTREALPREAQREEEGQQHHPRHRGVRDPPEPFERVACAAGPGGSGGCAPATPPSPARTAGRTGPRAASPTARARRAPASPASARSPAARRSAAPSAGRGGGSRSSRALATRWTPVVAGLHHGDRDDHLDLARLLDLGQRRRQHHPTAAAPIASRAGLVVEDRPASRRPVFTSTAAASATRRGM